MLEESTLKFVNKVRKEYSLPPLDSLKAGKIGEPANCVIAESLKDGMVSTARVSLDGVSINTRGGQLDPYIYDLPWSQKAFISLFDVGYFSHLALSSDQVKKEIHDSMHTEIEDFTDLLEKVVATTAYFNLYQKPKLSKARRKTGKVVRKGFKKFDELRLKRAEKLVHTHYHQQLEEFTQDALKEFEDIEVKDMSNA